MLRKDAQSLEFDSPAVDRFYPTGCYNSPVEATDEKLTTRVKVELRYVSKVLVELRV
nr:hypothetical protein [Halococcus sp. IIIV-5B]